MNGMTRVEMLEELDLIKDLAKKLINSNNKNEIIELDVIIKTKIETISSEKNYQLEENLR